jgi:hypothetical protein
LEGRAVRFSQARTPVPLAVSLDSGESVAATFAGENLNPAVAGFQAFFMCSAWRRIAAACARFSSRRTSLLRAHAYNATPNRRIDSNQPVRPLKCEIE